MCVYQRSHTLKTTTSSASFPQKGLSLQGSWNFLPGCQLLSSRNPPGQGAHDNPIPKPNLKSAYGKILSTFHNQLYPLGRKENKTHKQNPNTTQTENQKKKTPQHLFPLGWSLSEVLCPSIISLAVLVITAIMCSKNEAREQDRKICWWHTTVNYLNLINH